MLNEVFPKIHSVVLGTSRKNFAFASFCYFIMIFGMGLSLGMSSAGFAESASKAKEKPSENPKEKPSETPKEPSDEEKGMVVHEQKTRAGVRIAPPSGKIGSDTRARSAVEELLSIPPGESSSDDEMSAPAEGVFEDPAEKERRELERRRRERNLQPLDRELSGGRKSMDERHSKDLMDLDRSLGVESDSDPEGGQSYTLAVIQLKRLFKAREYEEALILLTELLRQYPLSVQLLMMKGTLHQRLDQIDLALAAYEKAFEEEPSKRLKAQIDYLKRRSWERNRLRSQGDGQRSRLEGTVIPLGVEETRVLQPGSGKRPSKRTAPKGDSK